MSGYIERMQTELDELLVRTDKASKFTLTETYFKLSGEEQCDLRDQIHAMRHYASILSRRIARASGWLDKQQ